MVLIADRMDEFDEIILSLEACASKMPADKKPFFFKELGRLQERIHQRELFYTRMLKNDPRVKPN
jgi:hypothetical protein